jgi:hypothetical protein
MFTYRLFNDDILLFESPCEQRHEPATEPGAHSGDRKEKVRVLAPFDMMPHTSLIHSTARHNTVYVRMVEQIGSPRMEDGCHSSEESFIGSKCINGTPGGLEHTVVEDTLMSHSNRMQTIRHREYDMEVLDRDNLFPAELNPLFTLLVLTLGAMPVTTAVVADMHIPTLGAHLYMPTKDTGPALGHVGESLSDRCYDVMLTKEIPSMTADDLSDVETGPHRFGGKIVSISRTCFIGSMSAT